MADISPSVYIKENQVYPGLITPTRNIACYVGEFEKGPIDEPVFISTAIQFKQIFGRALEWNYNNWYQVYNYLLYASGIWVCRTAGENRIKSSSGNIVANSPGEWGDLLNVFICDNIEYYSNIETPYGPIKNIISDAQVQKEYLVLIYRKDKLVEFFNVDTPEINSNYLESIELKGGHFWLQNGHCDMATEEQFRESFFLFTKENYEIDIIIGNDKCNDIATELAEFRKDCVAYLGLPPKLFDVFIVNDEILTTEDGLVILINQVDISYHLDEKTKNDILLYIKGLKKSQYSIFVVGFKVIVDRFTNRRRNVNIIGDICGLKSLASSKNPWDSGVGLEKGRIKEYKDTKCYINKTDVNEIYKAGANCLELDLLMSQKMFITENHVIDRLYLRNCMNYLERASEKLIRRYVFNENVRDTRGKIAGDLKLLLEDIKLSSGIEAGKVQVKMKDEKTIIINIYIKFNYKAEFVKLNVTNSGTNIISETKTAVAN